MRPILLALLLGAATPAIADAPPAAAVGELRIFQLPDGARVHDVAPAPDGKIWYTA